MASGAGAGHGLGGLLRRSTWLRPFATFADFPPAAPPGAVAIALDTGLAYEFKGGIWVNFPIGGSSVVGVDALREVRLLINMLMPVGTVLNIQTGAGGGPATVFGDPTTLLAPSGLMYAAAGIIVVLMNGQSLNRGSGLGVEEAQWISATQLAFSSILRPGDQIRVISPLPPP